MRPHKLTILGESQNAYWDRLTVYWDLNPRVSRPHLNHQHSYRWKKSRPKSQAHLPYQGERVLDGTVRAQKAEPLVCYTAVFGAVTQHSSWEGALRDDTKKGCVAD